MAELLRSGHTMLNIACPVCNNPVFQNLAGEKFCPTCNREVRVVNEEPEKNSNDKLSQNNNSILDIDTFNSLREGLRNRLLWIAGEISSETDVKLLERYSQLILILLDTLRKLSSFE
ncbi:MAG: Sjogren's syndrome/scleroderma autoantigen 1 family protein [Promethearchaeota archaeon]|jgi:uncharacterized Zn finger protein (UPF0148 family)